jgi:hypothetical protein
LLEHESIFLVLKLLNYLSSCYVKCPRRLAVVAAAVVLHDIADIAKGRPMAAPYYFD